MRDIEFCETRAEYEASVWDNFLPIIKENQFYRNLIQFAIDEYTPMFYRISDPSEHFAFSGAYFWETRRERYDSKARENLFWLHDFTHMLFPYAHNVFEVSGKQFLDDFVYQERIASTETEVFSYYRVPGLRELVFPDEVLYYDVITERGYYGPETVREDATQKPDAAEFLRHRNLLVNNDEYGEQELGDYPDILRFFQQWRRLTPKWVGERYKSVVGLDIPQYTFPRFNVDNYEAFIEGYHTWPASLRGEDNYRANVMRNVKIAYAIMGWDDPPTRWRHMGQAVHRLEGAVFFK